MRLEDSSELMESISLSIVRLSGGVVGLLSVLGILIRRLKLGLITILLVLKLLVEGNNNVVLLGAKLNDDLTLLISLGGGVKLLELLRAVINIRLKRLNLKKFEKVKK